MTIHHLGLDDRLQRAMQELGFTDATEVQTEAIPAALQGKDLLVSARTGSGKTAAFLLPLLHRLLQRDTRSPSSRALILLPTRELAIQTLKTFQSLARFTQLRAGLIIGGEAFKYQVATLRRNPEVIIATPGRLVEQINKGNTDFSELEVLVLDEADRMLDMGFAEAMHSIMEQCPEQRQNLFFSATLKHRGIDSLTRALVAPISIELDPIKEGHGDIQQLEILADDIKHKQALTLALVTAEDVHKTIIFCKTRAQCQQLSNLLEGKKVKSGYIHGELGQSDRKQILGRFRDEKLAVLVATDIAARGLDIANVDLVINYTVAHSGDDHVHRIGRTGRSGQPGRAVTLVCREDWNLKSSIERYLKVRFQPFKISGLEAEYKGPKKLKSSGKAAGTKKKTTTKKNGAKKTAVKKPAASKFTGNVTGSADGNAPLRRKKQP